jgi:DNA-binding LytR/AlgR family response regulator
MFKFLQQPYPLATAGSKIITPLVFGVFIALFLYIFRPFGLDELEPGRMLRAAAGLGLVTFGVIFLEIWIGPLLMPAYFREASWTVGREIFVTLTDVFLIGLGNLIFSAWYLHTSFTISSMIWFQAVTVVVGVLPLALWTMYSQLKLQKKYAAEARTLDAQVQERKHPETAPAPSAPVEATLQLTAEQGSEGLQLNPEQLLYIAAADNYIKVYHLEKGIVKQTMLRSSLKRAATGLEGYPQFFRCHRTFLVNLDHVTEVSGNAQGYKLQLAHTGDWVPVSRSLHTEIRERL